ncbi:uncharacterized protein LOC130999353 [Salvia miltiorrhiza]|uniref:uncharacterized protein LOC130999353 n=1 Tax=Salvia miltiorrhiza TaxID=226208 RepID=UPI0025AD54BC|nr:uncharacterized protein LOC130999353 [Salvia miltiorrhiza]
MIAIARRNLSCLFANPNSFLCNSNAHFFPSIHFFSTWRVENPNPEIHDLLLNKYQFHPVLASLASSGLPKSSCPIRADSVVSFLKENGFTATQLQKVVAYFDYRVLGFTIETMNFKFNVFRNLGLCPKGIAKIISENPVILHSNYEKRIIPRLSTLKRLLGSDHDVARLLKRRSHFLLINLEETLLPNMEILKSYSIPMELIRLHLLQLRPRFFLLDPDTVRRSVVWTIEFGIPHTSAVFIQAANLFTHTSEEMWEVKAQTLRDLGFSDDDILTIFKKQPSVFSQSEEKMKNVTEHLLATGRYKISSIVTCPVALQCSVKKTLEPRLQILRLLESMSLIEKWPSLSAVARLQEVRFFDRFVKPYCDEIGERTHHNDVCRGLKEAKLCKQRSSSFAIGSSRFCSLSCCEFESIV